MQVTLNRAAVILFITSFFLGWFIYPLVLPTPATVFVLLSLILLAMFLWGRGDAILVVIGIIVGFAFNLAPAFGSGALGDAGWRMFLCLWLLYMLGGGVSVSTARPVVVT